MSTRNQSRSGAYRVNLKLDSRDDADIIAWLRTCPNGQRSEAVREAIRRGLGMAGPTDPGLDLEAIRQVIADELARSLTGLHFQTPPRTEQHDTNNAEMKYGAKLDRMLGGLTRRKTDRSEEP